MRFYSTKFRGIFALAVAVATLVVSILVAAWSDAGVITKALIVLVVSISGFHVAAWYAFERKRVWLVLDYALETVTVVSLFAAVAGIQQSAVSEILQGEFARRKAEQAQLVYVVKSTITNDCYPKESRKDMWTPSPEPYPGACDRIEHFLPQVEYIFGQETGIETMTADDSWARNFIINDEAATGSWRGLYDEAKRFIEGVRGLRKFSIVRDSWRPRRSRRWPEAGNFNTGNSYWRSCWACGLLEEARACSKREPRNERTWEPLSDRWSCRETGNRLTRLLQRTRKLRFLAAEQQQRWRSGPLRRFTGSPNQRRSLPRRRPTVSS